MKNWLKALWSETLFSVWWILSAFSTLSTFFLKDWSGKPRLVSAISASVGFAWVNFRVFQRQQTEISRLKGALSSHETRISELRITLDTGSRYILVLTGNVPRGDFNGGYFEFHLMIENTGRRNSTVNHYQLEILELRRVFPTLPPVEGRDMVRGRHCNLGLHVTSVLSNTGTIRILAETATNHGTLLFFIPDISLEQFINAGLQMKGLERKFDPLHCRLTLTDTTESSATGEFFLEEN